MLKKEILEWANNKNLLNPNNVKSQFIKTVEEVGELANSINKNKLDEAKDAIGDIYVTLVILSNQLGLDIDNCIESAYNEIKNRTGKTVDGTFIKD